MHRQYASLAASGQMVSKLPAGSILFSDSPRMADGAMNYFGFMGDFELYAFNTFSGSAERAFAGATADPNNPNPLQKRRVDYDRTVRNGKSPDDLAAEAQTIVTNALTAGRHVFIVAPKASIDTYQPKYFPRGKFTLDKVTTWSDQIEPMLGAEEPPRVEEPRNRRFAGRQGPGGQGPGAPGAGGPAAGRIMQFEWTPVTWSLIEVKLKTPAPATEPAVSQIAKKIVPVTIAHLVWTATSSTPASPTSPSC
jgi:hypothetical protein